MSDIFEERFVVFIDILGFGAMVNGASKNPDGLIAKTVDQALSHIENMKSLDMGLFANELSVNSYRSHIFSDCIVMSVNPEPQEVSVLFVQLAKLTVQLMSLGVWIRGGMSYGLISKRSSTPWGPAIVEAYKVESQLALNPRIALSKSALNFVTSRMYRKEEERLIVRDDDGVWSLAPVVWALRRSYGAQPVLTEQVALKIKEQLEIAYRETVDEPRVFRKIDWLSRQWDKHVMPENGFPEFDCRTQHGLNSYGTT